MAINDWENIDDWESDSQNIDDYLSALGMVSGKGFAYDMGESAQQAYKALGLTFGDGCLYEDGNGYCVYDGEENAVRVSLSLEGYGAWSLWPATKEAVAS